MLKFVLCFLLFLFLCILLAPFLINFDILQNDLSNIYEAPNFTHFFGTDFLGRDMFALVLLGLRNSLFIGICSAFLSVFFACFYLFLARVIFYNFFMRMLELFLALPGFLLMLFFQSFFNSNIFLMIFLISAIHWCFIARLLESELKRLENSSFYKASIVLGSTKIKAFFKDLLPALRALIFTLFLFNIVHSIATEATLSYFGLGLSSSSISLGIILNDALNGVIRGAYWVMFFPLLALILVFLPLLWLGNFLQKIWGVRA